MSSTPAPATDAPESVRPRRFRLGVLGWTALGAVGVVGAVWLARAPLAHWAISQALAGVEHRFTLSRVELDGVTIADLRVGPAAAPDLAIARASAGIVWRPLPSLDLVAVDGLRAKARLTDQGFSFGALDRFLQPTAPGERPRLPAVRLDLSDLRFDLDTPLGPMTAAGAGEGRLRQDFTFTAALSGPQGIAGEATARSTAQAVTAAATLNATRLVVGETQARDVAVQLNATLSADADQGDFTARAAVAAASIAGLDANGLEATTRGVLFSTAPFPWTLTAQTAAAPGVAASDISARGEATLSAAGLSSPIALEAARLRLTQPARAAITTALPSLADAPFGPTFDALRTRLLAAGDAMALNASGALSTHDGVRITAGEATLSSTTGAQLTLKPGADGFALSGADFWPMGSAALRLVGGGLPELTASISAGRDGLKGRMTMTPFSTGGAVLSATLASIEATREGAYRLDGALTASGPLAGGRIENLALPLQLQGRFGEGFSIAPQDGCLPLTASLMIAAGGRFSNPSLALCAQGDDFLRVSPNGALSGGVQIAGKSFTGALADTGKPARLQFEGATLRFSGAGKDARAEARAANVAFVAELEAGLLNARAGAITARFDARGVVGAIEAGGVDGAALPVSIANARVGFQTEGDAIALSGGQAIVSDRPPPDAPEDWRARFNTLRIADVQGLLDEGVLRTTGAVQLDARGQKLGVFSAEHVVAANRGKAQVAAQNLLFDRNLDAFDISDPIRGVASAVNGALDSELNVTWDAGALAADGWLKLTAINFNTAAFGRVEGVNGEIRFDDLLNLKSLPNQRFTIGRLDPGIGVVDGDVRFQVLSPTSVRLESARWPFAGGALTIDPQTLDLSSRNFAVTLGLTEVDLSTLVEALGEPDLRATGRVTGRFPLQFDEEGGAIVNGVLQSLPGGGDIAYTGPIADTVSGPPRLAFDALQSFRYDDLKVTLNGRLEGDITGSIAFKGINTAPIRDLSDLSPIPGVTVPDQSGLPFEFDVAVSAPFRQLLQSYQGLVDARTYARRALDQQQAAPEPRVDQPGPPPR